jgi:CheY-like chemotaxis protein
MKSYHVVLVEDDPDDIELFKEALKETEIPHDVHVIMQGDIVLDHLVKKEKKPDIIVLDLNIPKRPGKEILGLLKSSAEFKKIPVVILTTSSSRADMEFCLKGGAEKFITKPVNSEGFEIMAKTIFSIASNPGKS